MVVDFQGILISNLLGDMMDMLNSERVWQASSDVKEKPLGSHSLGVKYIIGKPRFLHFFGGVVVTHSFEA